MSDKLIILTAEQIKQKLNRIAYQILEDNVGLANITLAGINVRGMAIAERLRLTLQHISNMHITLVHITANNNAAECTAEGAANDDWRNQVIVLIDDVLDSGTTMTAAFGYLLKNNHPKIRTVVLVDRSHKVYPLATDFVGLRLSTVINDHVYVVLNQPGQSDHAYLI